MHFAGCALPLRLCVVHRVVLWLFVLLCCSSAVYGCPSIREGMSTRDPPTSKRRPVHPQPATAVPPQPLQSTANPIPLHFTGLLSGLVNAAAKQNAAPESRRARLSALAANDRQRPRVSKPSGTWLHTSGLHIHVHNIRWHISVHNRTLTLTYTLYTNHTLAHAAAAL